MGAVRWSFQTVRHDLWDYDLASAPILLDRRIPKKGASEMLGDHVDYVNSVVYGQRWSALILVRVERQMSRRAEGGEGALYVGGLEQPMGDAICEIVRCAECREAPCALRIVIAASSDAEIAADLPATDGQIVRWQVRCGLAMIEKLEEVYGQVRMAFVDGRVLSTIGP